MYLSLIQRTLSSEANFFGNSEIKYLKKSEIVLYGET